MAKTRVVPAAKLTTNTLRAGDYLPPIRVVGYSICMQDMAEDRWYVATISRSKLRWLLSMRARLQRLRTLDAHHKRISPIAMQFVEHSVDFFPRCPIEDKDLSEEQQEELQEGRYFIDHGEPPAESVERSRIEYSELTITEEGFYWTVIPKHTSIELCTHTVYWGATLLNEEE